MGKHLTDYVSTDYGAWNQQTTKLTERFRDAVAQELLVIVQVDESSDVEHPQVDARLAVDDPLREVFAHAAGC